MQAIHINLAKLLEERGMSRYELAKRTDISYQIIDNYYKDKNARFDGETVKKICSELNCSIGDLIEFTNETDG